MSGWAAARRPLTQLFIIGCTVSLVASTGLTLRVIADGVIGWSMFPLVEVGAFAVVRQRSSRRQPFGDDLDAFYASDRPLWLWTVVVAGILAALPPRTVNAIWTNDGSQAVLLATFAIVAVSVARTDYRYFRIRFARSNRDALGDVILYRAIAWSTLLTIVFFKAGWPVVAQPLGLP